MILKCSQFTLSEKDEATMKKALAHVDKESFPTAISEFFQKQISGAAKKGRLRVEYDREAKELRIDVNHEPQSTDQPADEASAPVS